MASTRTFLRNASVRHAIFVERFSGSQLREMTPFLERARDDVLRKVANIDPTSISKARLDNILNDLDLQLEEVYRQMGNRITENLGEFAEYEGQFNTRMLNRSTDKVTFEQPSQETIRAATLGSAAVLTAQGEKLTIEQALAQYGTAKRKEFNKIIRSGVIAGATSQEMIQQIRTTEQRVNRNHASALVRTLTNHISTEARLQVIEGNEDVVDGFEFVATLDGNTTDTCKALDGQVFAKGEGPRPPMHWGCRSTMIPVVKPEFSVLGKADTERPAVGADGAESVGARTDYQSWLKKQPAAFQDEALGATKGKLFREGGLTLDKFVDSNYSPYTIEQLRRKERLAFDKAGLID